MKRQISFDGIIGCCAITAFILASINMLTINRVSTEQAARTNKVYKVDPNEHRIVNLERTSAVHEQKLEKRQVWMEGVQADIVNSGSDRFTMSDYLEFTKLLKKLNPGLNVPELKTDSDGIVLPLLPRDQD